jgi:hypothetical protein
LPSEECSKKGLYDPARTGGERGVEGVEKVRLEERMYVESGASAYQRANWWLKKKDVQRGEAKVKMKVKMKV